jgi:hypothetical protein
MATPIQYIPQPIFSNVGMLQQQLAQDQARHDLAMQQQVAMEDMFAEVPTHPTDIPIKNKVLGDFQSKVQEVVDRYGGDYGAAAKDIARLTSKTRQNPFFQLAPERRRLAEEQRKRLAQLGPNAILTQDVTAAPLQDPETGEWITPEELQSQVLDQRLYEQQLERRFGKLGTKQTPGEWRRNAQFPWMLERSNYKGVLPVELQDVASQMYESLSAQSPELPESERRRISDNYANQLVQGSTIEERQDPEYLANVGKNTDASGRPLYQRYTGNISESQQLGNIQSQADENIERVHTIDKAKQTISNITDILSKYDITPSISTLKKSVSTSSIPMNSSTRQSINRVKDGEYSLGDLKNKWSYNISNAVSQAVGAAGQYLSNLSPVEKNKRFGKIRDVVHQAFMNREQNPEELSSLLSVLGENHEYVALDPETGLYQFNNKGLDLFRQGRESAVLVDLTTELQFGIDKNRDRLKEQGDNLQEYIEKNPVITEAMETLKQNNPDMDDITIAQTAIQAAANHKKKQAATHFSEVNIYDKEVADNLFRRVRSSVGEMSAIQIEDDGGQDDVNLKEVLSEDVGISDISYIPGENMFKVTTNEPKDNNYKIDATNSKILPKEAVDTQKKVSDFLGSLRDLTFENTETFKPQVVVDGIPYSAYKAYNPETNEFVTSIITINPINPEQVIPVSEGEFLTRYADSVTRRLGYQRKRKAEQVQ